MTNLGTFIIMRYDDGFITFPNVLTTATNLKVYNLALILNSLQEEVPNQIIRRNTRLIDVVW